MVMPGGARRRCAARFAPVETPSSRPAMTVLSFTAAGSDLISMFRTLHATARFPQERRLFDSIAQLLDQIGSLTFWTCISVLVVIDVIALAVVIQTRSRELVNRWTGRLVAANALLLGAGVGIPMTAYLARSVVIAVAPSVQPTVMQVRESAVMPPK